MTVNLLSSGRLSGISHVRSLQSSVSSLNKRRKRKQLEDPHLPGGTGQGRLVGNKSSPLEPWPSPVRTGNCIPGNVGAC